MRTNFHASLVVTSVAASFFATACDWSTDSIREPHAPLDGRWLLPDSDYACDDTTQLFLLIEGREWKFLFNSSSTLLASKDVSYEFSDGKIVVHANVKMDVRSDEADFQKMSFEYHDKGNTIEMIRVFSGDVSFDMEHLSEFIGGHHFERLSICESSA